MRYVRCYYTGPLIQSGDSGFGGDGGGYTNISANWTIIRACFYLKVVKFTLQQRVKGEISLLNILALISPNYELSWNILCLRLLIWMLSN